MELTKQEKKHIMERVDKLNLRIVPATNGAFKLREI